MIQYSIRNFGVLLISLFFSVSASAQYAQSLALDSIKNNSREKPESHSVKKIKEGLYENSKNPVLYDLIQRAQTSIDIEIYEMNDPEVRRLLTEAIQRSVRLRIVKDPTPMGSNCSLFTHPSAQDSEDCLAQKNFLAWVRTTGNTFTAFDKDLLCGEKNKPCFQHGKMAIFDEKIALMSTGNFDITNLCNLEHTPRVCNRDYTYVTYDQEVIQTLKTIFESDLSHIKPPSEVLTPEIRKKMTVSPYSKQDILNFIHSAQSSIQVVNQYLNEQDFNQALIEAAQRGVQITVLVSSACSFGRPEPQAQNRLSQIYSKFDQAGIRSRFFTNKILINGRHGYMHAKAIVIDQRKAWVGSINGSMTAFQKNREFGIFFSDAASLTTLQNSFASDFNHPETESWQESIHCTKDEL